jgi:prepilin signal peptidase PulO-like enzyme (type II secretory pathway)
MSADAARSDVPLSLVVVCLLIVFISILLLVALPVQLAVLPLCAVAPTLLAYRLSIAGMSPAHPRLWIALAAFVGAALTAGLAVLVATLVLAHKTPEGEFEGMATGFALAAGAVPLALLGAICAGVGAIIGQRRRSSLLGAGPPN